MKFKYIPLTGSLHKVFIAGDFNDWNPEDLQLKQHHGIYEISIDLPAGRYEYKFVVDGNWIVDESADEIVTDKFGNRNSVTFVGQEKLLKSIKVADFNTPNWVKDGIIYQIFTDRFCNADKNINPDFSEWYYQPENKLSPAARERKFKLIDDWYNIEVLKEDENKHYLFYGGDLAGVKSKIDYLVDLGITIIYFNPLVQAASNHKYEAYDYFKIDPHFGTNDDFIQLVKLLHNKGIRVIVDFAFNHVGIGFFAFQDCLEKGKKSKYYHWFDWHKWPLPDKITKDFDAKEYYQCWWGHSIMPDLNFDLDRQHPDENYIKDKNEANVNEDVVGYILEVADFWLKQFDIDGFRLDIPNEVPFWFWKMFRKRVKQIKPDAYLVGEIWHNAYEWVNENYFDAVMNYKYFKDPIYDFFIGSSTANDLAELINTGLNKYPPQATQVMMNLLDSHDTFRFLQSAEGNLEKLKLAVLFQMTFVGTPHIFYGDEIAMMGGHDPDNRRPFNWKYQEDEKAVEIREWYKKLIKIRRDHKILRKGDFELLKAAGKLIIFRRYLNNDEMIIIINNSSKAVELEEKYNGKIDIISNKEFNKIPAFSGIIIGK